MDRVKTVGVVKLLNITTFFVLSEFVIRMSLIKQETVSLSDDSDQDYDSPTINSQADSLGSRTSTSPSSKRTSFSRQNTPSSIASSLPSESCDAETANAVAASATPGASSNTATSAVRNVKARVPENFVPMTTRDLRQYSGRYSANTELWLVQVPQGVSFSDRNGGHPSSFSSI